MRPRSLLILAAFVLFLALATGFALTFRLVYVIVIVLGVAALWRYGLLRNLTAERRVGTGYARVGETLTDWLTIRNQGWLPQLWIRVDDQGDFPDHNLSAILSLRPRSERTWFRRTTCQRRGVFRLGPVELIGGDPWGLFEERRPVLPARSIVVYPQPVPIPRFDIPVSAHIGGGQRRKPTQQPSPNAFTIRDYVNGDSFNRIHWASTARLGRLMVKEHELDPVSDLWILLDGEAAVQAGSGAESTEEYGVTIAASLAQHYLVQNRSVGLIASGSPPAVLVSDRGDRQWPKILQALAAYQARGTLPLSSVLSAESGRFGRTSTVILITSSVADDWVPLLHDIVARGIRVAVILLEPETFGDAPPIIFTVSSLAGLGVPCFLVKQGDDLTQALSIEHLRRADREAPPSR